MRLKNRSVIKSIRSKDKLTAESGRFGLLGFENRESQKPVSGVERRGVGSVAIFLSCTRIDSVKASSFLDAYIRLSYFQRCT